MGRGAWLAIAPAFLATGDCLADSPRIVAPSPVAISQPALGQPPLVPLPAEVIAGQGTFFLGPQTAIRVPSGDSEAAETARYFANLVARSRGLKLVSQREGADEPAITFERQPGHGAEGYRLAVAPGGVHITATSSAGLFYGAVTLWQLLPSGRGAGQVPAQVIRDAPAYAWRGVLLDSARHIQSPQFVKSMIDWMAWHKLNVLHWHLTDDQGWRIEIHKYPQLTRVGAWREPATAGKRKAPVYGGYYTQAQVRDIVAYAASRHIQVVPEIDMPGHAQAAVAAYPALGSTTGPAPPVSAKWGVHPWLFNLEPETLTFLEDVLEEVMALFPSPYIHVGGDEAVKDQWNASPIVQARARALGVADSAALQTWFTQEIGRFLARHGRRLVGWDEILQPGLASEAVVMSWRGTSGAHAAAIAGNDTVLSPWPTLYFDNQQSALASEPPGRMRVISLEDVYRFEPRDPSLTADQQKHVLGVQANIWTEHIRTEDRVQWMALPRAAALAEVAWTAPERRQWSEFLRRLVPTLARYRALGLHYADSVFAIDARISTGVDGIQVALANQAGFGEIHYTTDSHAPTMLSPKYSAPLLLQAGTELRAATFAGDQPVSSIWRRKLDTATLVRRSSRELDLCSDGISLLLEPNGFGPGQTPIYALDLMNPCWIYRDVDLTRGARLVAAVGALPFNFEIGANAQKIRVGDARTTDGELEARIDGCEGKPEATQALTPVPTDTPVITLPEIRLPARAGRHDVCLRFARPRLDPMWALDWVEIKP
jgi:hexosaminidase